MTKKDIIKLFQEESFNITTPSGEKIIVVEEESWDVIAETLLSNLKEEALRQPPVISSFVCGHPPNVTYLNNGVWHCEKCGGKWESIANK